MQAQYKTKFEPAQAAAVNLSSAINQASIDLDNAKAIIDLTWQNMSHFDRRALLPEQYKHIADVDDTHRRALDAVTDLLERAQTFFYTFDGAMLRAAQPRGDAGATEGSEGECVGAIAAAVNAHKWALDRLDDLCGTQDQLHVDFDPSPAAAEAYSDACRKEGDALLRLLAMPARSRADRMLKAKYLRKINSKAIFEQEHIDALLAALEW